MITTLKAPRRGSHRPGHGPRRSPLDVQQDTCRCGCGAMVRKGRRWVHGHNRRIDLAERFWARVDKADTCWLWRGQIANNGYGHLAIDGTTGLAHRLAYELLVGPIPDGLTIDHLCRVKHCVNPAHLEPVTSGENTRRAYAHLTHCPQGHEYTSENMLVRNGERHHECARCNREAALRRYHARKAAG